MTSNMPQVAIDARYVGADMHGIARYILTLLRGIAEADAPLRIAVLVNPVAPMRPEFSASPTFEVVPEARDPHSAADQIFLPRLLRRLGVGVLHSPDAFAPVLAPCRRIVTIHDAIAMRCRHLLWAARKRRLLPLWQAWHAMQCRMADAIVTVSHDSAADLARFYRAPTGRIHVVYNGIMPPPPPDPRRSEELRRRYGLEGPILLYAGRRDPYKNVVGLIRIFARVRRAMPSTRLVIAGKNDPRYPEPERETARLGLNDAVIFAGLLDDADLYALYRLPGALAFASLFEGFGLTPIEAMGAGMVVVAGNRGALPEVLGDAAVLADPRDENAFAEAVLRVLRDSALAERLRARGHQLAARYTPLRQAQAILRIYQRLLARG